MGMAASWATREWGNGTKVVLGLKSGVKRPKNSRVNCVEAIRLTLVRSVSVKSLYLIVFAIFFTIITY